MKVTPARLFRTAVLAGLFCLQVSIGRETAGPAAANPQGQGRTELSGVTADLPFSMSAITLPRFPQRVVNVADFGGVADGRTANTDAFAKAIDACGRAGGGRVRVPPGIWFTGPIRLKSNINLHLEAGAVILFSPRFEEYPLVRTSYEGGGSVRCTSPISGVGLENVAITGEGIIDGSGQAWRPVKKFKMTDAQWKKLVASGGAVEKGGGTWWPSVEAMNGAELVRSLERAPASGIDEFSRAREFLRPVLVSLVECRRVLLDGPTFQNSPAWNIHPLLCEDLVIRNVTVLNPWYSQNGDGLDLDSCRRAVVYNCRFDVGDDAICIKSGKDDYGRRRGRPCEEIVVSDCVVYHGHGGFTVGSEMSGGVRNIVVRRCTFLGTDVGLRFKTTRGRGGVVEKIWISDIRMTDIPTDAIGFNMYYGGDAPIPDPDSKTGSRSRAAAPVNEGTPQFRDIYLKNILCRGADRALFLEGLPEMPIRGITLENVDISARTGGFCVDAERIGLKGLRILPRTGPVLTVLDSRDVSVEKAFCPEGVEVFLRAEGERSGGIRVSATDLTKARTPVELGRGVPEAAVIRQ